MCCVYVRTGCASVERVFICLVPRARCAALRLLLFFLLSSFFAAAAALLYFPCVSTFLVAGLRADAVPKHIAVDRERAEKFLTPPTLTL